MPRRTLSSEEEHTTTVRDHLATLQVVLQQASTGQRYQTKGVTK